MTPMKRRVAAVSAPILLALSLSACGGGAPTDASVEDFCAAYQGEEDTDAFEDIDPEAAPEEQADAFVKVLQEQGDRLEEVGTPEDMPDDARAAFEAQLEAIQGLDAGELAEAIENEDEEALENLGEDIDEGDTEALQTYVSDNC